MTAIGHDPKGNIDTDGTYTYGYSSENLLTSLANSAPGAAQPNIAFAYDPLMRLASIDSTVSGFDVEFGYDGQVMVLEGLSAGRTRRYVHGPGTDEPLVAYLVTPGVGTSRNWYQADERGSIVRLSQDSGAPTNAIGKYDEYGAGGSGRFRYTGQYWLGEANLLYYRARVYDARLGRFLQPDPIGYGGGMNMYAYVGGDPVNLADPSGLKARKKTASIATTCTGTKIADSCGSNGGIAGGYSGTSTAGPAGQPTGQPSGHYEYRVGTGPSTIDSNGDGVVTADKVWVPDDYDESMGPDIIVTAIEPPTVILAAGHKKNKRPSTKTKHQQGDARRKADQGGEKADKNGKRRPQRKRPPNQPRGPWPPKGFFWWFLPPPEWFPMCSMIAHPDCRDLVA